MAKNDKKQYKLLTEEDMKIIQSDPVGLADYVVATKVKSARKSALIVCLLGMILAFGAGIVCGMTWTKTSIPNNVVQIQVGDNASEPAVEATEEGK
jgi:hypothetical protein